MWAPAFLEFLLSSPPGGEQVLSLPLHIWSSCTWGWFASLNGQIRCTVGVWFQLTQKSECFMTRPFPRVNGAGVVAECALEGRERGPLWSALSQVICLTGQLWDSLAWLVGEGAKTNHVHIIHKAANLKPNGYFFLEQQPYFYMLWSKNFWLLHF